MGGNGNTTASRALRAVVGIALVIFVAASEHVARSEEVKPDQAKAAVPDLSSQKRASKAVEEVFKDQIARARTPEEKSALANKLIAAAHETTNDPTGKYIMISKSLDLAAQAGDVEIVMAAAEMLTGSFAIDDIKTKGSALRSVAKGIRLPEDQVRFVNRAESVIDEAVAADRYDVAKQVADASVAVAKRNEDPA